MVPEDVYELTTVSDPRLSPDGKLAAFVVTRVDAEESEYRSAIWVLPTDGSEPPRRLTSGDKADAAPRFSPDGTKVAFTSNRDGEKKQLYVLPLEGGEPQQLTDLPEDVADPVWSPDSARLVFASRVPDAAYEEENEKRRLPRRFTRLQFKLDNEGWTGDRRRHLFVVPADGSAEAKQLTSGDFEDSHPSWSPDGEIVFVSSRGEDWDLEPVSHLFTVSPDGGEPKQLTSGENAYNLPAWSPDGRAIACRWREAAFDWPRHERVAVVDPETGEHRSLTESLDRHTDSYPPLREPAWDGDDLVFGVEDGGNVHLYRVPADGSRPPEPAVGGDRWISGWDAAAGELVYTASTPTSLPELYRGEEALTSFGATFAEGREVVQPERFTATSKDGTEVEAWILRPAGFEEGKRYPVILSIHGGPFTQYGNKFFDEFQVYAGAGYVVVYSNPRGSSGYSEEWGRAIRGPVEGGPGWGSVDYEDLMAVVDEALGRYEFCDSDRLGVTGGSYGGYMTTWIAGHTDRFRAACSERAVNSMVSQYGSSDIGHFIRSYTGAYLYQDFDAYVRLSPITYAENITTPMLILHSENDLRCNIEQAEQLYTTLRLLRRDVELVRFPGEGHELTRSGSPAHRVQRFEILLDWFGRRL